MAGKVELVNVVQEVLEGKGTKYNKEIVGQVIDAVLEGIVTTTVQENKLQLMGFGNFEVRERAARKGRNPQTSEEIDIPAKKVPVFKPGKAFKESVL
ncbi:HU family DNA-binding protein [Streptomyces sp. NPDC057927]